MNDPRELFPGTMAIVAPHPDDETLGCGGLIARLAGEREIHVLIATDGSRSPVPSSGMVNPALVEIREGEAREALGRLGVPPQHVHFLRFPDGQLSDDDPELQRSIADALNGISPATVLVPFRYDWHSDHMVVHRVTAAAHLQRTVPGVLIEYFVYTQRRLLPGGDVRTCLAPGSLWAVETASVAARKREALECFRSQTTRFFDWQQRPILTPDVLARACDSPEIFLPTTTALATRTFIPPWWIGMASKLEPRLKHAKDGLRSWMTS
jgi:LmbE family N-acetylglucosaminyl deacetylase